MSAIRLYFITSGRKANSLSLLMFQVLFDVLKLAIEQLLQSAKVEHSRRLPYKESGFYSVYFVEHGVVVDGQFLESESKEFIGHTGITQRVVVDDGVLFT